MNSSLPAQVKFAVYGALQRGNADMARAVDVTARLQEQLRARGSVAINNDTMGGDPAPGTVKHFGAIVIVDGKDCVFACQEGETVDFHAAGPLTLGVPNPLTNIVRGIAG